MKVIPSPQWKDKGTYKEPVDSDNIRVPRLEVDDASTYVDKDGSNNLTFTDAVTGTKTLAQLGAASDSEKVKVDAAATADYIGAGEADGALRVTAPISLADGGDFVTLSLDADGVKDTHIDWGAGAGQVDADDVPGSATKKWAGETGATTDQTGAEIKTAYEAEADTNAYTDAEKTKLGTVESSATADQAASEVEVSELGTATYDDVQDFINFFGDRTYLTGCAITPISPADGTVAVASGTAWCKETDSNTAVGKFFNFAGQTPISLTDLTTNLLYLDYNAGTPQVVVATSALTAFRNGTDVHILQADPIGIQGDNRSHMMRVDEGASRSSGIVTSATGTRNLSVTAGVLHLGLNRKTTSPYTTPNAGTADDTEANKLHDADGGFATTDVIPIRK